MATRYYAQFDHTAASPVPVTGWYDVVAFAYPTLPAKADLLALTDQQWAEHIANPSGWAVQNGTTLVPYTPPAPPPSADQLLAQHIAQGIAITSQSSPTALNATYAMDSVTLDQISAVARDSAAGLGLPMGLAVFQYPDMSGTMRSFNGPQIEALYKAMRDLVAQLNYQAQVIRRGGTPTWPPQTGIIP